MILNIFMFSQKIELYSIFMIAKYNLWLAEQLGVNQTTVSKWCTNICQPDLHTLSRIAELLNASRRELLRP